MRGIAYMLELPAPPPQPPAIRDSGHATTSPTAATQLDDVDQDAQSPASEPGAAAAALPKPPAGWSTEGLQRLLRHGGTHLPAYTRLAAQHPAAFGASLVQQVGKDPLVETSEG